MKYVIVVLLGFIFSTALVSAQGVQTYMCAVWGVQAQNPNNPEEWVGAPFSYALRLQEDPPPHSIPPTGEIYDEKIRQGGAGATLEAPIDGGRSDCCYGEALYNSPNFPWYRYSDGWPITVPGKFTIIDGHIQFRAKPSGP